MFLAKYILVLFVAISIQHTFCSEESVHLSKDSATDFLSESYGLRQKRFVYTGKEQRREAKENYEEKCERSALSKMRNKPRWCPHLGDWDEWMQAVRKDGVKYGPNKP